MRIAKTAVVMLSMTYASAALAAGTASPYCGENIGDGQGGYYPPECANAPFYEIGYQREFRVPKNTSVGGCPAHDVIVHMPSGTSPPWSPLVFLHGGGAGAPNGNAFAGATVDTHGDSVNPYHEIAEGLASSGFVVIQPILGIGPGTMPWDDAANAADALQCIAERSDPKTCTGTSGTRPCLYSILNNVAWSANYKENIVVVGHSAGAVAGLYLPEKYMTAVKGMIMIDPAKDVYLRQPPMLTMVGTATPVVHFYPDFYGPLQNASNGLFRLGLNNSCVGGQCVGGATPGAPCSSSSTMNQCGTGFCTDQTGCSSTADCPGGTCSGPRPTQGPWVPIGIRDYPGCNPDTGCHESHHCTGMSSLPATPTSYGFYYANEIVPQHYPWCGAGVAGCTKTGNGQCPAGTYCTATTYCSKNSALNQGHTWTRHRSLPANAPDPTGLYTEAALGSRSSHVLQRYVQAYAACLGGKRNGNQKAQPWVTGQLRAMNDAGGTGGVCSNTDGVLTPACSAFTYPGATGGDCTAAGCLWNRRYDPAGPVIRINNGQTVTDYTSTTGRFYSAAEGFNPATGSFVERQERLGTSPSDPFYLSCSSGPGLVP